MFNLVIGINNIRIESIYILKDWKTKTYNVAYT